MPRATGSPIPMVASSKLTAFLAVASLAYVVTKNILGGGGGRTNIDQAQVMSAEEALQASENDVPDAIIILGGGTPSSLVDPPIFVKNRCDIAAEIHKKAKKMGSHVELVPLSAGTAHTPSLLNDGGRPVFESAASAAYMVKAHQVDPNAITMETTSWDTLGNAYFVRAQICDPMGWKKLWVVTSKFHMPRTKAIFDWIFSVTSHAPKNYQLRYIETENVGLTDEQVRARETREMRSLKNVHRLADKHKTLEDVLRFLVKEHKMYSAKGLFQEDEKVSEAIKKSYKS